MTTTTAPAPSSLDRSASRVAERSSALDIARGVAIILVVLGHSIIGVQRATGQSDAGRFAIILIYSFHMALFFFVSGLLSTSALREPAEKFAKRLLARMVYPYFLWSSVILLAHYKMSGLTNTKVESFDLLSITYRPPAVMWFLYVLFFCFLLARASRDMSPAARLALGVVLTVGGYFMDDWLLPNLRFVGIFLIATALTPSGVLDAARDRRMLALGAVALLGPILFAFRAAAEPAGGYPAFDPRYLPAAAGGILLILAAAQALAPPSRSPNGPAKLLAFIGARTMPIFVTHILVLAAVRIALIRLEVENGIMIVVAATACGILVPMLAYSIADRLSLARLLGWK